MADLDSCYFCGTFGDGLTELAVVPPRFDPTDDQQRTVVLCTACRQKLGTVLEPLVDVLGGAEPESGSSTPDASSPSPEPVETTGATDDEYDAADTADADDAAETTDADDAAETTDADDAAETTDANDARPDEGIQTESNPDPEQTPTVPSPGDAIDTTGFDDPLALDAEGVTIGTPVGEGTNDDDDGDDATSAPDSDGSDASVDPDEGSEGDDRDDAGHDRDDAGHDENDAAARAEEPAEFRTVMRLLSNREFPVDRAEIESLASGAYELDDSQVRDILDHAVDRGVLAERNGQLHRD
ncbi:hypothetical protein [Haloprofundus sp. MHR1]|uniref:hypothetical protein n=1 Tax=Haloprofundus sp. MHR1 TaxID=2572921 RepID=UPI00143DA29E|nr:hypothetical protein [Haloprofundus sp. MHR1]